MAKKSKEYIVYDANTKFKKDVIELLEDILETLNSKNNTEQVAVVNEEVKPKAKPKAKKKVEKEVV